MNNQNNADFSDDNTDDKNFNKGFWNVGDTLKEIEQLLREQRPEVYDAGVNTLFPEQALYFCNPKMFPRLENIMQYPRKVYKQVATLNDGSCILTVFKNRLEDCLDGFLELISECNIFYGILNEFEEDEERNSPLLAYQEFCLSRQ